VTDEAAGVQANRGPRCGGLGSLLSTLRQLCAQDKRASAEAEPIDTRNGAESQPGHGLPLLSGRQISAMRNHRSPSPSQITTTLRRHR